MPAPEKAPAPTSAGTADAARTGTVRAVPARSATSHGDFEKLPQRLSISRAKDYIQCPKLFYFKTILGISTPSSIESVRGNLAHAAFERIFDHPAGERTPDLAVTYIAPAWEQLVTRGTLDSEMPPAGSPAAAVLLERAAEYRELAPAGSDTEANLLATTEQAVRSWFDMEKVNNFTPTDLELPDGTTVDGREIHVIAQVLGVPLHGFIDRLDRWVDSSGNAHYSVSDYKTGKAFDEGKYSQYSEYTQQKIADEAFLQLRVYAVLCYAMLGVKVDTLRLIYVKTGDRVNGIKTRPFGPTELDRTSKYMQSVWASIEKSAKTGDWPTKTGPLCQWCFFNDVCPATGGAELGELLPEEVQRRLASRAA